MFPPTTIGRPTKRSLRELVREAVDTAAAFATLGEAMAPAHGMRTALSAPTREHPHRRHVGRHPRRRRPGSVAPRAPVCVTPVTTHRPARR
jgi:hypothetical protein